MVHVVEVASSRWHMWRRVNSLSFPVARGDEKLNSIFTSLYRSPDWYLCSALALRCVVDVARNACVHCIQRAWAMVTRRVYLCNHGPSSCRGMTHQTCGCPALESPPLSPRDQDDNVIAIYIDRLPIDRLARSWRIRTACGGQIKPPGELQLLPC